MMNQEDIFKKIGQILSELNDQYQYLAQNPGELNELELELFLANANFLTDHVQIIRKLNSTVLQQALPEHTESAAEFSVQDSLAPASILQVIDEPAAKPILEQEMFKLDKEPSTFEFILNEKPSSDLFEFEEKSVGEIFDRPLSKEEEEIIAQKQKLRENDSLESELPEEDEIGPEPFLVAHPEPGVTAQDELFSNAQPIAELPLSEVIPGEEEIILDEEPFLEEPVLEKPVLEKPVPVELVFEEPAFEEYVPENEIAAVEELKEPAAPAPIAKLTLNDILSGKGQTAPAKTETSRAAITDLKQSISLNDKLRYIRDLFNGYNLAYAEAIDLVNKMPDFKTADNFLKNNYAAKHNWASKQETVDQFYELLNQRFPAK